MQREYKRLSLDLELLGTSSPTVEPGGNSTAIADYQSARWLGNTALLLPAVVDDASLVCFFLVTQNITLAAPR